MNKGRLIIIMIIAVFALSACGKSTDKIVIASKPMTEQYIIAEMLTLLIEENTSLEVEHLEGVGGGTSNIHPAMLNDEIDIYPEYTGTGWLFVLDEDLINDPMELYASVKAAYKTEFDIVWTGLYGFNNTYAIAVPNSIANDLGISDYDDLAANSSSLSFGAEYDFYERADGFPGLNAVYGFDFADQVELDIGLKYQAIEQELVDVINVFSTDGRLREYDLKVLDDNLDFFPSYFAASLVRQAVLDEHPELLAVLEMLTDVISNEEMTNMNYLVEIENKSPQEVAYDFLYEKGLIS